MDILVEKFTVSGKIISELSEKIPSNVIALNELIKNSYDAGADNVCITLDTDLSTLTIYDDGIGFDNDGIKKLLHIAESEKKYGSIGLKKRKVQGSKGLGFLSVFKFGQGLVKWKTTKTKGYIFEIDYNTLLKSYNLSDVEIQITEDDDIRVGTEIVICLDDYNKQSLIEYFLDEKSLLKTLYSFINNDMSIEIKILPDNTIYNNKKIIDINKLLLDRQIYNVEYKSNTGKLKFKHKSLELFSIDYPFPIDNCELNIDLAIFNLQGKNKSKINKLFWDYNDSLMPLLYVNDNFFFNTTLFDPNVNVKIKTGEVLNQIIGKINIISSRSDISFNSDRTQFTQNKFSDLIKLFLQEINKYIQSEGSKKKNYLVDKNFIDIIKLNSLTEYTEEKFAECIHGDFSFASKVEISFTETEVTYKFGDYSKTYGLKKINADADNKVDTPKIEKVKIDLFSVPNSLPTSGPQINLRDYILSATDSEGKIIHKNNIQVYIDNVLSNTGIIPSIDKDTIKKISYVYNDKNTGKSTKEIDISFIKPENKAILTPSIEKTFTFPVYDGYTLCLPSSLNDLVTQYVEITQIKVSHNYAALRSASLRVFFEVGADILIHTSKDRGLYVIDQPLGNKVKKILKYCKTHYQIIANSIRMNPSTLDNRLSTSDIYDSFLISNLGSHSSTSHLSDEKIANIQDDVSLYIVLINELINNTLIP